MFQNHLLEMVDYILRAVRGLPRDEVVSVLRGCRRALQPDPMMERVGGPSIESILHPEPYGGIQVRDCYSLPRHNF